MGDAGRWTGLALGALVCGVGCGGGSPPTFTTPLGIEVWVYGRTVQPEEVDVAVLDVVEEFSDRYAPQTAQEAARGIRVSFLDSDTYVLYGQNVAGNTSYTGDWVYVGAKSVALHKSAFAHEWVHALDLQLLGVTDDTHASWKERIYPGLERVNARIAEREAAVPVP